MKFNIIHIYPNNNQGPESYNEVIATVTWGLEQLGYTVSYRKFIYNSSINDLALFKDTINKNAINIVFGAQILHFAFLEILPENTIIYNLEQRYNWFCSGEVPQEYVYQAKRFIIWDYSEKNIAGWKKIWPEVRACYVKIGYAPILNKIDATSPQDIDVLFYGGPTSNRLKIFSEVCSLRLKSIFAVGFFGSDRDELIARSKVVLNMHMEEYDRIFEIVRASYLMANSKVIVSELSPDTFIEDDIRSSVVLSPLSELANHCQQLVLNDELRLNLGELARKTIEARDIREILSRAWIPS